MKKQAWNDHSLGRRSFWLLWLLVGVLDDVHFALAVLVDDHVEALPLELRCKVQDEEVVERHVVSVTAEDHHEVV